MFDWIPELLYFVTKTILQLIDGLVMCANMLCGIEPISVGGDKDTNFLVYIFQNEEVGFAFKIALILGFIVLVFATIYAIIKNLTKEKPDGTPGQICVKAAKLLLTFLFIPVCMIALIWIGNEFVKAIYSATSGGSTQVGTYLFTTIGSLNNLQNADLFLNGTYSYTDVEVVWSCIDLWDYNHFLVWLLGGIIIYNIIISLMQFIDRIISLVILYIVSPFSVASSILDDGAHFKLWRDQVMIKFFTCYGMILALNVFVMLTKIVINPDVVFFANDFLNFCMKAMVILGGAFGLNRSMALIGNLISAGAGSNEMRDAAQTQAKFGRALATPFSPLTAIAGEALQQKKRDLAGRALSAIGLGIKDNGQRNERGEKDAKSGSNDDSNKNNNKPKYNDKNNGVSMAIANLAGGAIGNGLKPKTDENQNDKKGETKGSGLVNDSINQSINNNNTKKNENDGGNN